MNIKEELIRRYSYLYENKELILAMCINIVEVKQNKRKQNKRKQNKRKQYKRMQPKRKQSREYKKEYRKTAVSRK